MNDFFLNISYDIFSGIITTIVIFVLTFFTNNFVIPFIKKIKYEGADISGEWHHENNLNEFNYIYTFKIEQNAHDLKGFASIIKKRENTIIYNQPFKISGLIYDGFVILNLKSKNTSLSFSTGLFEIQSRGEQLSGILSYRNGEENGVSSEQIILIKV